MNETPTRGASPTRTALKASGVLAAAVAAIFTVVGGISALLGLNPVAALLRTGHRLGAMFTATWPFWVIVASGITAGMFQYRTGRLRGRRDPHRTTAEEEAARVRHARWKKAANMVTITALATSLPLAFLTIRSVNRFGHDSRHDAIQAVLEEEDGFNPDFLGRLPYPVAGRKLIDSVGEGGGIKVEGIWRFDVDGTPKTCGLLVPEKNAWKRPISGVVCIDDAGHVERASFSGPQVPSWKVAIGDLRLTQVVNEINPQSVFTASDIYGYIESGEPVMVVPTTKLCGGAHYVTGWAGAVVFGNQGSRLVTDPTELQGPVAGESLADEVLNGLNHRGGFLASRKNLGNFDAAGNDANPTHHLLAQADGTGERLVTLLTPKGDSNTPVAALSVDPRDVELCGWPRATLHHFPTAETGQIARASVAEAEQTVIQRYGAALQLENTKLVILETQLTVADEVTIALGSDRQVMTYIAFNLQSRETVVYDRDRVEVRRDAANATVGPQGLRALFVDDAEADTESDEDPNGSPTGLPGDLADLTDRELIELLARIAEELDQRNS